MKKAVFIALAGLIFSACSSAGQAKPIDYVSPCACYDIVKFTKFKG